MEKQGEVSLGGLDESNGGRRAKRYRYNPHFKQGLSVYYLDDSLAANGISGATLQAMWDAVDAHLDGFSAYLTIKAKEHSKEKLSWLERSSNSTGGKQDVLKKNSIFESSR